MRGNWVDGVLEGAQSGDTFAVAAPVVPGGERSGAEDGPEERSLERDRRWPRSEAADLERGLRAAEQGAEEWQRVPQRERARALRAVLRQVESDLCDAREAARFLGLHTDEFVDVAGNWRPPLELRAARRSESGHVAVVAPDWSELCAGTGRDLVDHAVAGRAVLLLADPRFPHLGDLWARAWERRAPVPNALTVLHGATPGLWAQALTDESVTHASFSGPAARFERWGVEEDADSAPIVLESRRLRNATAIVHRADDVRARAETLFEAAFGLDVLGGQLPGQVGRIVCHARVFSAFTAALLDAAEAQPNLGLPFVDPEAWYDLQNGCKLGLDEGATQILGGASGATTRGRARVQAAIFTNVEPAMRLPARDQPAALVSLIRAESDGAARELLGVWDQPGWASD